MVYWAGAFILGGIAGSLKLGTVRASELIRSLLKSERPSSLAQAIIEVGRINKTLHLLNYIDDEDYRRRILNQLNRGEGRHSVARTICYGQRGEIRKRYREGQEDQLGALGHTITPRLPQNLVRLSDTFLLRYLHLILIFIIFAADLYSIYP